MLRNLSASAAAVHAGRHRARATAATVAATRHRSSASSSTATSPAFNDFDQSSFGSHTAAGGHVRHSAYGHVTVPNQRIDQFVWRHIERWQSRTAVVCGETDRSLTYAQLRDCCAALAVRLRLPEFALGAGDVVALCLPNSPDFPIACLGAMEAGLTVTTVNPIYNAEEIAKQLVASEAKILFGSVEGHATLVEAIRLSRLPIRLVCARSTGNQTMPPGCIDLGQLADPMGVDFSALSQSGDFDPNAVAFLPFSSGTTGLPKGVCLSHNNITTNFMQTDCPVPVDRLVRDTVGEQQEVIPAVLPFFHIYGFTVVLASKLAMGCKVVTLRQFAPDRYLHSLAGHGGSVLYLVPPIVNFLSAHASVDAERHLGRVHAVLSGAAPMRASDVERFVTKANRPIDIIQAYGMTETSPVTLMNISRSPRFDSCGAPSPNTEVKICDVNDPTFRGLGANQSGEMLVRGPQVMLGYHNNPAATAEMLLPDGWLRTGDVAHYDEQGYFYVTDRLKELIKVKGFQVPPAELEALLRAHPLIADAAVIGQSHPGSGEVPLAFVVRKAGGGGGEQVTEQQVKDHIAERVSSYKWLDGVRFVEAIPKTATGKILRRELKRLYSVV